jgi:periplasmic protein TonB
MKLSPLKLAFATSLLVHGTIFSAVYAIWHGDLRIGARSGPAETTQMLEIIVEPDRGTSDVPESQPAVVEAPPPVPPVNETKPAPVEIVTRTETPEPAFVTEPAASTAQPQPAPAVSNPSAQPISAAATPPADAPAFANSRADYLFCPKPVYPREARQRRQEGLVVLSVWLSGEGLPEHVNLKQSSGFILLDKAAAEAVKRWRFAPALIQEKAVASQVEIPIRFKLTGSRASAN